MSLLTQVSIPDALIIFFLTLGPLKALAPFAQATLGTDSALLRPRQAGHGYRRRHCYRYSDRRLHGHRRR